MGHVFISYSSQDEALVNRLRPLLNEAGVKTWVDSEGIQAGAMWRQQIVEAITSADAVLLLLSPNSVTSANVRKELDIAEEAGKRLLPIEAVRVVIPKEMTYQLAGVQRIDLTANFDRGVEKLLAVLRPTTSDGATPNQRPREVAQEHSRPRAETPSQTREFETVWYRPADKGLWLKAYSASGRLSVDAQRVVFGEGSAAIEVGTHEIKAVDFGKMSGDPWNDWVILRYGESGAVAGFKDGSLMGWGKETDQIYSAIRTVHEKRSGQSKRG